MSSLKSDIHTEALTRTVSLIISAMVTAKGDVWNPSDEVVSNCNAEVSEVLRSVFHSPLGPLPPLF